MPIRLRRVDLRTRLHRKEVIYYASAPGCRRTEEKEEGEGWYNASEISASLATG